jgi:hypothetical protein
MALGYKADLLGTAQRTKSFPLTYGQDGAQNQTVISEYGTMAAFCVMKKKPSCMATVNKPIYGLAFQTGRGNVVLGHTSFVAAGPGKWTFVPNFRSADGDDKPTPTTFVGLKYFETKIFQLTIGQGSP